MAGQADILVAPNLESGNMIAKQLIYLAGAESAGIVIGARVPIMLTSARRQRRFPPRLRRPRTALCKAQRHPQGSGGMSAALLVLNIGSSTIKFALYTADGDGVIARGRIENVGGTSRRWS